ncbi:oligopeptide transporter [Rhizoctonia solani]|uniref:Oligopeptide transporter n=1 Tax=Rhizoctonia solani TaxID=456999 RepID=A0A8H7ICC3_9AGAM|nr:oligopeptide transporter [Rhizoctonia solani]
MSRPYSSAGSNSHPPYMDPRYQYPETPTTASTSTSDAQWAYGPGSRPYTGAGEDLYEEDESEDEDVFAYLPPTTAEQQATAQQQQMHIQPATAPLASVQPVTYPNSRPALSSPTPVLPPTTPVHPSAARHIDTPDSLVPPESFRMRTLKERVPRQNKTPEVHVSLEDPDPELGRLRPKRSISSDHVMEELPGPSELHDHKFAKTGDGATLSSLHFTSSRRSDFSVEYEPQLEEEDDSPYPEVRASVSNIDDPEMPALTFRVWAMGLFLCMLAASANTFFNFRYPAPSLAPLVMLFVPSALSYTHGSNEFLTPDSLPTPSENSLHLLYHIRLSGSALVGRWNIFFQSWAVQYQGHQEHVLLYIMSNVATAPGYAMNVIIAAEEFYNIRLGLEHLPNDCDPINRLWSRRNVPSVPGSTRIDDLASKPRRVHPPQHSSRRRRRACAGGITRFKFFLYVSAGAFLWQFLPGFLFTALSAFSWICWFRPRDLKINQLFGVYSGLGMGVLTFDWSQIAYIGSPLMVPWWAEVHVMLGFIIFYWILAPIMYYKNPMKNIPGSTSQQHTPSPTSSHSPSPPPSSSTPSSTTAQLCWRYQKPAHRRRRRARPTDASLPRSPGLVVPPLARDLFRPRHDLGAGVADGYALVGMPFSLLLPTVYIVPIAYVYAMTGQPLNINLLAEVIPGSLIPGKPLPNMIFKSYAVQSLAEALTFVQDLKLGHYIKVSPRATFMVQMVSTLMSAFVQVGVKEWMFRNVKDICKDTQPQKLTCPHNRVYFTASAVWRDVPSSAVRPALWRDNPDSVLALATQVPQSRLRYVNMPVLLNGPMWIPPATGINYSSWFVIGFLFQYVVRRRNFRWWSKFNYALSAALDSAADYMKLPYLKAPPEGFS